MKIKSKQTLIIRVSNEDADNFCRGVKKVVEYTKKPGYKNTLLNDDEKAIFEEIYDTIDCADE